MSCWERDYPAAFELVVPDLSCLLSNVERPEYDFDALEPVAQSVRDVAWPQSATRTRA